MGNSAKTEVFITLQKGNQTVLNKIFNWIEKANTRKLKGKLKGEYDLVIEYVNQNNTMINVSIGGRSLDNARFQLENLSEFCNKIKEVTDFDSTQWVQTEAISWCRDE